MLRHATGALRRVAARRQASTLILADHDGANMTPSTLAALTAASKLNETSAVLVHGRAGRRRRAGMPRPQARNAVFHVDAPPSAKGIASFVEKGGYSARLRARLEQHAVRASQL